MADESSSDDNLIDAMNAETAARVLAALDEPEKAGNGPSSEEDTDQAIPSIEGYVIDRRLGSGGGGQVYRAVRVGSDHPLAIKILRQRLGESPEARRAWREIDVLQQLRLPAIPRLLDHGIHDGRLFLVTEFVQGLPLVRHCEEHQFDRQARVELLAAIAEAVHSLHERGIIHRDLKPSNILVDINGQPVLIDLGIATLLTRDVVETLTADGVPVGSPAFMASEQARGDHDAISTRSDVYSLGATAYVLLTGQTPHDMNATLHEAIRRVAQDAPRHPRELDPTFPKPLAAILAKAAAPHPGHRYASSMDLATDLRRWLKGDPVHATRPTIWLQLIRWVSRHAVLSTAGTCAFILISSLLITLWMVRWLALQPSRIVFSADRLEARLEARGGNILHTWTGPFRARQGTLAELVDGPEGPMAIIGFPYDAPEWGGQLCAFDLQQSLERPVWSKNIEPELAPRDLPDRKINSSLFAFARGCILDCVPDSEGLEILAVFKHGPHSQCVLRVFSLDGQLLFQACHDGGFDSCHWLAESGLLVLTGLDERGWDRADHPESDATYMRIVLGLRPEAGLLDRGWLNRAPGGGASALIAWYYAAVSPDERFWVDSMRLGRSYVNENPRTQARLDVKFRPDPPQAISIAIGHDGNEIRNSRVHSDARESDALLPDSRDRPILYAIEPIPAERDGKAIPLRLSDLKE